MYDTLKLSMQQGYLDFFMESGELPLQFVDNQSALALSKQTLTGKKSKHINLRYHVVRDYFRRMCYVPTDANRADPLTKPLPGAKYLQLFLMDSTQSEESDDVTSDESDDDEAEVDLCTALGLLAFDATLAALLRVALERGLRPVSVITMSASTWSGSRKDLKCYRVRRFSIITEGLCFGGGGGGVSAVTPGAIGAG